MNIKDIIIPIVITCLICTILGVLIAIVSKVFFVKKEQKLEEILKLLPGYNCGACGKAGCLGLAEAICKDEKELYNCKPMKEEQRIKLINYLNDKEK